MRFLILKWDERFEPLFKYADRVPSIGVALNLRDEFILTCFFQGLPSTLQMYAYSNVGEFDSLLTTVENIAKVPDANQGKESIRNVNEKVFETKEFPAGRRS